MKKIKVAVNGYGTIGMRVADAVLKQEDMILVGITKSKPDFRCEQAREKGIDVYSIGSLRRIQGSRARSLRQPERSPKQSRRRH